MFKADVFSHSVNSWVVTASLKDTRVQQLLMGVHQMLYLYDGKYLMNGTALTLQRGVIMPYTV